MKRTSLIVSVFMALFLARVCADPFTDPVEHIPGGISMEKLSSGTVRDEPANPPITIDPGEVLITNDSFRPPIEITIVAKTDSTNLRISYTAAQVIFNWELNKTQLRVDGGPADGKHQSNKGLIPVDTYVTIRWDVTDTHESIYVDDDLRFHNSADYSKINNQISVFGGAGSTLKVTSLTTKYLEKK